MSIPASRIFYAGTSSRLFSISFISLEFEDLKSFDIRIITEKMGVIARLRVWHVLFNSRYSVTDNILGINSIFSWIILPAFHSHI